MIYYVLFADEKPFPGISGHASDRKIIAVTDNAETARALLRKLSNDPRYVYADFETFEIS